MKNLDLDLKGIDILVLSPTPTYPIIKGNCKRIYSVCQQLRNRGSKIHFLHYPQDWVNHLPLQAIQAMSQQWDSFHLVPTTRPLQTPAIHQDHRIDEWWDPAIGDYLKWLFSSYYFDAFIVNYTYLSKAFEFAPSFVYRILDTHDKFTERRQLLADHNIAPEFFYTTQEQEAIALKRADLVWAIKDEEALFFRKIANTPVCTLLHTEPRLKLKRQMIPGDEDYLVLGILGVGNSINTQNVKRFLKQALAKFCRELAPIKIKIAGSLCATLEEFEGIAGVELMGRVEQIEEFYQAIDVVLVPLSFSTGLKIKAAEALATGLPIVAHRHAFEGIPVYHRYQTCDSFEHMANACLELAYHRSQLLELVTATQASYRQMQQQVEEAMRETAFRLLAGRPLIVIVFPPRFFQPNSLEYTHTLQTIDYFKYLAEVVYYIDTPLDDQSSRLFQGYDLGGRVVLSPQAAKESGLENQITSSDTVPCLNLCYSIMSLEELCNKRQVMALWLLDLPRELHNSVAPALRKIPTYIRTDVISQNDSNWLQNRLKQLQEFKQLTLVHCSLMVLFQQQGLLSKAEVAVVPYWRHLPETIRQSWKSTPAHQQRVILLVHPGLISLAYALWQIAVRLFPSQPQPLVLISQGEEDDQHKDGLAWQQDRRFLKSMATVSELYQNCLNSNYIPKLVIDLSCEDHAFAIYIETLKRAGVPLIRPQGVDYQRGHSLLRQYGKLHPNSTFGLVDLLNQVATQTGLSEDLALKTQKQATTEYSYDAGWSRIWREMKNHKQLSQIMGTLEWVY